jgi:dCMP deaminase
MKHTTWMAIANVIAQEESKCISHKVGAVIVKDNRIVSTGYNGTPTKQPNCCDVNKHLVHNGEFQNFVSEEAKHDHHTWSVLNELHAEHNAIMYASPEDRKGATLYCTLQPCQQCSVLIAGSGITKVIYETEYHRTPVASLEVLKRAGIEVIKIEEIKKDS